MFALEKAILGKPSNKRTDSVLFLASVFQHTLTDLGFLCPLPVSPSKPQRICTVFWKVHRLRTLKTMDLGSNVVTSWSGTRKDKAGGLDMRVNAFTCDLGNFTFTITDFSYLWKDSHSSYPFTNFKRYWAWRSEHGSWHVVSVWRAGPKTSSDLSSQ